MNRVTDREIWIESEVPLAGTSEWAIPLRLVEAVAGGKAAKLGSVSPRLAGNLETIRDIYAAWIDGGSRVPLAFESRANPAVPGHDVSLFFSGGVDSFFSLITHRDEINNLVLIHGFDIPLAETRSYALAEAQAREAARLFGKRLIVARTNLHWEESRLYTDKPRIPCDWGMYHGAALAAVAHALSPNHRKVFIASSYPYAALRPWGSHPLLDPLWSTETLQVVHDGGVHRQDKLRVVAQHPEALARLRVCWENLGNYNCGQCRKCIQTMLGLRALGIDHCAAFPDTLSPEIVRRQELSAGSANAWRRLLSAGLPPDLQAAVRSAIHSYEMGLPPRTGTTRREIKRWLTAARIAGRALVAAAGPRKGRGDPSPRVPSCSSVTLARMPRVLRTGRSIAAAEDTN